MVRKLLFIFVAAILFANQTQAQIPGVKKVTSVIPKVMFGVKAGANFNELSSSSNVPSLIKAGLSAGRF